MFMISGGRARTSLTALTRLVGLIGWRSSAASDSRAFAPSARMTQSASTSPSSPQTLGVNLVVGAGELSEVACRMLVERVEQTGKPARILYISDFDPGGLSMPVAVARKVEFHLRNRDIDADITLRPIVLTEEQCVQYRLPRTPIKEEERRKGGFENRFGHGATELDALEALHSGIMRGIVNAEINRYLDTTLADRTRVAKARLQDHLSEIANEVHERHQAALFDLQGEYEHLASQAEDWEGRAGELWSEISDELESSRPDLKDFPKPEPRPANEPASVLFDSSRDYLTQLDSYRDWQGRNSAEDQD